MSEPLTQVVPGPSEQRSSEQCPSEHLEYGVRVGPRLAREVLQPMKEAFVGKDEVIDLLGVCLAGGENLFILGPPGTAKSALVRELGDRLEGRTFDYLLTRFTEPNEIFGPMDIRRLREGELITNTDGMLPEASLVFLDELLNAGSAILNSLLMVLNERRLRRGKESFDLPLLMVVGASNHLPEEEALTALFDRFLLRVRCDNVADDRLGQVLDAGWALDAGRARGKEAPAALHLDDIRRLQAALYHVDLEPVRAVYVDLVARLRLAGISISDRRAVKLQRLVAASALLCGRTSAATSDLWIFKYIWDREEQQEILAGLVSEFVAKAPLDDGSHPRAPGEGAPDPEAIAREIEAIREELDGQREAGLDTATLKDRLGILSGRSQWVRDEEPRNFLLKSIAELWDRFEEDG